LPLLRRSNVFFNWEVTKGRGPVAVDSKREKRLEQDRETAFRRLPDCGNTESDNLI